MLIIALFYMHLLAYASHAPCSLRHDTSLSSKSPPVHYRQTK